MTNSLTAVLTGSTALTAATVKGPALVKGQIVMARTEKARVEVAGAEAGTKAYVKRTVRENELLRFEGSKLNSAADGDYAATNLAYKNNKVVTLGTEAHGVSYYFTNSNGELLRLPVLADPGPGGALCWGATKGVNRYRVCFSVTTADEAAAFAARLILLKEQVTQEATVSDEAALEAAMAELKALEEPKQIEQAPVETRAERKARLKADAEAKRSAEQAGNDETVAEAG